MKILLTLATLALLAPCTSTDDPIELGLVNWQRDLDGALTSAREKDRVVFALFQEIPGCSTCQNFGAGPLSHPLLVEAIEDLFVPLAIYNNRPGRDAEVLKRYGEPSWNNPVVRFLDDQGRDVIERRDRVWSTHGIAQRARLALEQADRDVPAWLLAVELETLPNTSRATFAMSCYWQGEARLGQLDGVLSTEAGWMDGREVVEVRYDARRIGYDRLVREADRMQCATRIYADSGEELTTARRIAGTQVERRSDELRAAKDSDQKYFLKRSGLRYVPLTTTQRTKVNAALGTGSSPAPWLSPRQAELLRRIESALRRDRSKLDGLEPVDDVEEWAAYLARLETRLTG